MKKNPATWVSVLLWTAAAIWCGGCGTDGAGNGNGNANTNANANANVNDNTPANMNDNGTPSNTNDNASQGDAIVKTLISLGYTSGNLHRIEAGDDLVVFADPDSIRYIVPTESDRETDTAAAITGGGTLFGTMNWKVAGKKVALVRSNNRVSIFDTQTESLADIPGSDITLHALPTDAYAPGHITSDGNLVATINDTTEVADGNAIKVIDVGGATPQVISFPNPTDFDGMFNQVAVNAQTRQVAAHGDNPGDVVFVFDVDNPTAAPLSFDFFGRDGFTDRIQMQFDGEHILYRQRFADRTALHTLADDSVILFPENNDFNPGSPVALNGGSFGYFLFEEEVDAIQAANGVVWRSSIGRVATAPAETTAGQLDFIEPDPPSGTDQDFFGKFGYGSTICITPDGIRWFIAGFGAVDPNSDVLQMGTIEAGFTAFQDPEGESVTGRLMASDVSCSSNTVAFWALRQTNLGAAFPDNEWVVGFIVLSRLE